MLTANVDRAIERARDHLLRLQAPAGFWLGELEADITITAANVLQGSGAVTDEGTAGGTITAGQALYADASDLDSRGEGKLKPAIHSASASAAFVGIALHGASDEQPIEYLKKGNITIGGTVAVGEPYYISGNAGGIAPDADIGAGDYVPLIGIGISARVS